MPRRHLSGARDRAPRAALVIRFLLHVLAYLLLAAAFAVAVTDAMRSFEAETLDVTRVEQAMGQVPATDPRALERFLTRHAPRFVWDPVAVSLLRAPAALVLAVVAVILFLLVGRRPRRIGLGTD
jgi:hypothetical protein